MLVLLFNIYFIYLRVVKDSSLNLLSYFTYIRFKKICNSLPVRNSGLSKSVIIIM